MTIRTLLTRTALHSLAYGCLLWSAVMIGASDRPSLDSKPVYCLDLTNKPGHWDCQLHRRIPATRGEIGSIALPDR